MERPRTDEGQPGRQAGHEGLSRQSARARLSAGALTGAPVVFLSALTFPPAPSVAALCRMQAGVRLCLGSGASMGKAPWHLVEMAPYARVASPLRLGSTRARLRRWSAPDVRERLAQALSPRAGPRSRAGAAASASAAPSEARGRFPRSGDRVQATAHRGDAGPGRRQPDAGGEGAGTSADVSPAANARIPDPLPAESGATATGGYRPSRRGADGPLAGAGRGAYWPTWPMNFDSRPPLAPHAPSRLLRGPMSEGYVTTRVRNKSRAFGRMACGVSGPCRSRNSLNCFAWESAPSKCSSIGNSFSGVRDTRRDRSGRPYWKV